MALQILRVIAGRAKGRKLKAPPGGQTRPSGDRLKEALFSSLGEAVEDAAVLDLFAGSGALGIEALSRGAARATFVETDPRAVEVIEANLAETGLGPKATVIQSAAAGYLETAAPEVFDLVLIDPPYEVGLPSQVFHLLLARGFARGHTDVVLEASVRRLPFETPGGYVLASERRYGDSALLRFRLEPSAP